MEAQMEEVKDEKIERLLDEYSEQRDRLKEMIHSLEELKGKIEKIFPSTLDTRYIRFFEEKIKTATSMFSTILEVRKEILKSLKEEVELRKKYQKKEGEEGVFDDDEIRSLAIKVEKITKKKEILQPLMERMERELTAAKIDSELLPDSTIKSPEFTTVTEGYNPNDKKQGEQHG
jgi:hypothetical protein